MPGCCLLVHGCWLPAAGCRSLPARFCLLVGGCCLLWWPDDKQSTFLNCRPPLGSQGGMGTVSRTGSVGDGEGEGGEGGRGAGRRLRLPRPHTGAKQAARQLGASDRARERRAHRRRPIGATKSYPKRFRRPRLLLLRLPSSRSSPLESWWCCYSRSKTRRVRRTTVIVGLTCYGHRSRRRREDDVSLR